MTSSPEQLLELTRQVFRGHVTRLKLSQREPFDKAFVGVAIMLAARARFLNPDNTVRGPFWKALEDLLSKGTANPFVDKKSYTKGEALVHAAARAGLYKQTSRAGGVKPILLTPPLALTALVNNLGYTEYIARFIAEAETGSIQHEQWFRDFQARQVAGTLSEHVERVVRQTHDWFGREGLQALQSAIQQQLKNS